MLRSRDSTGGLETIQHPLFEHTLNFTDIPRRATAAMGGLAWLADLTDATLCRDCRSIPVLGPDCYSKFNHITLSQMEENAPVCHLCKLFVAALTPTYHPAHSHAETDREMCRRLGNVTLSTFPHPQTPNEATYLMAYLSHSGLDHGLCTVRIYKLQQRLSPSGGLSPVQFQEQTRTRKFSRICAWLREDWDKWEASTDPFNYGQYFPPRLLDLGVSELLDGESLGGTPLNFLSNRPVRLINTGDARTVRVPSGMAWIPYAALSHRWGPSTELCNTTKDNVLRRYRQGIMASQLCKTFQDAIVVALELGIPYLWIDSLCIVQDDEEDWKRQSGYMDDIYMNAIATIAAHSYGSDRSMNPGIAITDSTDDGGAGFLEAALAAEGVEETLLGAMNLADPTNEESFLYARWDRMFEVDIFNSRLQQRGWFLQERTLSPRIIHFFHKQLYYESKYFGIVRAEDRTPAVRDPDELRELVYKPGNQEGVTPLEWFRVVERYSACHLTRNSDKLVAIAGIAKHFHKKSGVEYLAGLFLDRAPKGLLWLSRGPNLTRQPDTAPSWSWASVDGPIKYPKLLLERPYRVLPTLRIVMTERNSLEEPKHLLGQDNVKAMQVLAYVRKMTLGKRWHNRRDNLISYYPLSWVDQVVAELDPAGVYREIQGDDGRAIGWASFDEDRGSNYPAGDYYTAIVASEEAWVSAIDKEDVIYHTNPPTPEYEALYATGKVAAAFNIPADEYSSRSIETSIVEDDRVLVMTYWTILLQPESPSTAAVTGAKFTRVGFGQIFEKRWQRPDDWRAITLN